MFNINNDFDGKKEKTDYFQRGLEIVGIKCPMCKGKVLDIDSCSEKVDNDEENKQELHGIIRIPGYLIKVKCLNCGFLAEFDSEALANIGKEEEREFSGWPIGLRGSENDPLTEMQKKFVAEYVKSRDRKEAAVKAGYPEATAEANATTLMCSRKIIKAIKKEREKKGYRLDGN